MAEVNIKSVGDGKVYLVAGGNTTIKADLAAKFVRSSRPVIEMINEPYNSKIVRNLIESNHLAALEFDYFIFAVEGYSRVTEVQLVRKRIASYLIKSGRASFKSPQDYNVVLPNSLGEYQFTIDGEDSVISHLEGLQLSTEELVHILAQFYHNAIDDGIPEEEARYLKPQATEFRALIGMNAHALLDWFKIRMCQNAQSEIRDLASKMCKLAKEAAPDLFVDAGPSCKYLGYCPENDRQNEKCKGHIPTRNQVKSGDLPLFR